MTLPKANNTATKRGQGHGASDQPVQSTAASLSPTKFTALVKEHGAEVRIKKFPYWTQFVAILFCHL
ncbi:hypothetical protein DFAR_850014 [Desulfarculales bacterium]